MSFETAMQNYMRGESSDNYLADKYKALQDKTAQANALPAFGREIFKKLAKPVPPSVTKHLVLPSLAMVGKDIAWDKAKEAKQKVENKIENEANGLMRQITYPEGLINEAVNLQLYRGTKK